MNKQFSIRLNEAIQAMGINPSQFARKARIPQGTISKCLNGHVPTARILLRVAKFTGQSVDWLLGGTEPRKVGEARVAERPARYGRAMGPRNAKVGEGVWVEKLLKVLRSGSRRDKETIKNLLDVLSR